MKKEKKQVAKDIAEGYRDRDINKIFNALFANEEEEELSSDEITRRKNEKQNKFIVYGD